MRGMCNKWSTQLARRVRVCAVLAMHVPNLDIHKLWCFLCVSIYSSLFFTCQKRECFVFLCCLSVKIGLLKRLRLVLRWAVCHSLSFFCRKQAKKGMHDTQCINRLGLFITRCRVV